MQEQGSRKQQSYWDRIIVFDYFMVRFLEINFEAEQMT